MVLLANAVESVLLLEAKINHMDLHGHVWSDVSLLAVSWEFLYLLGPILPLWPIWRLVADSWLTTAPLWDWSTPGGRGSGMSTHIHHSFSSYGAVLCAQIVRNELNEFIQVNNLSLF